MAVVMAILALCAQPWPKTMGYPGRFSTLRDAGTKPAMVSNGAYTLDTERVLKVHAIVPRRAGNAFGERVYGGSMSLCTPGAHWQQDLPDAARKTSVAWPSQGRARVTQTVTDGEWTGEMSVDMAAVHPALGFTMRRLRGGGMLAAGLIGWGWAKRIAPTDWLADGDEMTRKAGAEAKVAPKDPAQLTLLFRDESGFMGVLRFTPAPADMTINDDGLTWAYKAEVAEARLVYVVFPTTPALSDIDALIDRLTAGPQAARQGFGCDGGVHGKPWVDMEAEENEGIMLPASLADAVAGMSVPMVEGAAKFVDGRKVRIGLDAPPLLEKMAPEFRALPETSRKRIEGWAREIIARQTPDGAFSFGLQRGFYDGITCCALAEVMGVVSAEMKPEIARAVEKGLAHLWDNQPEAKAWPGVVLSPEQPGYYELAVDYPEIEACILQATALYAAQGHRDYAARRWPQVQRQFEQLRFFYDQTGIALAAPGPNHWHVIAESAVGGYLGWQAMYHLAMMADQPSFAEEARARAALAWKAWLAMFRWREEFGEPKGVVNGINNCIVECWTEPAWAYVQTTWFTVLPGFAVPKDDDLGVWRMLRAQPWWEWTGAQKSTQRAYDACNATALVRAGYGDEVKAHWPAVAERPFLWDSFDQTPVLSMAAEAWLAGG